MQLNTNYCTNNNIPSHNWCTYQATGNISIIFMMTYVSIMLIMGIVIIVQYCKLMGYRQTHELSYSSIFGRSYEYIYWIMFGWLICIWVFIFLGGLAKSGVNMWMYFEVMVNHQEAGPKNPNPRIDEPIVVMSNVFSFLDFLCVYFVVLLTLVIPYQWIYKLLSTLSQRQENQSLNMQTRLKIDNFFITLRIIKIYTIIQGTLFLIVLLAQPFIFYFVEGTFVACEPWSMNMYQGFSYKQPSQRPS